VAILVKYYIVWFQISVKKVVIVKSLYGEQDLLQIELSLLQWEWPFQLKILAQIST